MRRDLCAPSLTAWHCRAVSFVARRRLLALIFAWILLLSGGSHAVAGALTAGDYLVTSGNGVYEVDATTGDRQQLAALSSPQGMLSGIVIDVDWNIYFADRGFLSGNEAIYRLNPDTNGITLVSGGGSAGAGPALSDPLGLAIDSQGHLLVADAGLDALISIDPSNGNRTIISGGPNNVGMGSDPFHPHDVAVTPMGQVLVGGNGMNALLAVDPATGDRVPVSRSGVNPIGSGPSFEGNARLALGPAGTVFMLAAVPNVTADDIYSVDLATGNRALTFHATTAMRLLDMHYEANGDLVLLDEGQNPAIYRYTPSTAHLEYLSYSLDTPPFTPVVGQGPPILDPRFIAAIPARVPEPGCWTLVVPALATLLVRRPGKSALRRSRRNVVGSS